MQLEILHLVIITLHEIFIFQQPLQGGGKEFLATVCLREDYHSPPI